MRTLTLALFASFFGHPIDGAELNARDLVTKSISNYDKDWNAALDFTYTEQEISQSAAGSPKTTEVSQVSVLDGTPYSRLIGKNGHPLSEEEERRENEKYQKAISEREHETPDQRDRRIRKYREERRFLHEIPDAFDMKLLGNETIDGRANYVVELTPKADYVPKSKNARMFRDIEGKLWIDQEDVRWTQAEARVTDTISIGWFLARIEPGAHITMKQIKVDGEHWMPKEIDVKGYARILLVKNRPINEVVSYSDYKRVHPLTAPAAVTGVTGASGRVGAAGGTAAAKNR